MARRSGAGERARIEVLAARGFSDAQIAAQLGRGRATIWREKKRCAPGAYCARRAQAEADAGARGAQGAEAGLRRGAGPDGAGAPRRAAVAACDLSRARRARPQGVR